MNKHVEYKQIKVKLENLFAKKLHIDVNKSNVDDFNKHLLGTEWNLKPREMVYLLLEIEKEFGIKVPQKDIVSGRFTTYNEISDIIYEKLCQQAEVCK